MVPRLDSVEGTLRQVRELCKNAINSLRYVHAVLIDCVACELEHVILQAVWMNSELVPVAFLNKSARLIKVERFIAVPEEPVVPRSHTMGELADLREVVLDLRVIPEHEIYQREVCQLAETNE